MRRLMFIGPVALLLLALGSPVAAAGTAQVRVLHASPNAPAVDVYLDGAKVGAPLAGLAFGDLSGYVPVPAGTHAVKVCAAADASVCPIDVPSISFAAGKKYTIAATNALASIEAKVLDDATSVDTARARVRVVHFSADTPAVDVLTQDGSARVVENLAYPDATDYLSLAPGSYDLKVCAAADTSVCPLDPGPLQLQADHAYSVFAIGSLAGKTLTAVVGADAAGLPTTATVGTIGDTTGRGETPSSILVLLAAGALALAGTRRFARSRTRR